MNNNAQILQLLQNINAQLGELNIVLKENNLPVIKPANKRQIATYKTRDELYDYVSSLPTDKDIFPKELQANKPRGTSVTLLGRTMREMGWESTTTRVDGDIVRVWRYGHVVQTRA